MPSTFSSNLRLELIASGEQGNTWGNTTNNNLGTLIEQAISGFRSIATVWAANTCTLTALNGANDQARNMYLEIPSSVGLSAEGQLIAPSVPKVYIITNNSSGGFAVRIKTGDSTTTCLIPNGTTKLVACDGTNFYEGVTAADYLSLANAPTTGVHAANKTYVDSKDALKVNLNGSNTPMTGELRLSSTSAPSNNDGAVSKQFVADTYLARAGGTMSGDITLPSAVPVGTWKAVPKGYVDAIAVATTTSAGQSATPLESAGTAATGIVMSIKTATASSLGVVKGGGNVSIDANGMLSVSGVGNGTVTNVSGVAANGFTVSVSNPSTTPSITIGTSSGLTSIVKGTGTGLSNASGTDLTNLIGSYYVTPASLTTTLGSYVTSSSLTSTLNNYALKSYVTSQGYITSAGSCASATSATTANYLRTSLYTWNLPVTNTPSTSSTGVLFRTASDGCAAATFVHSNDTNTGSPVVVARTNSTNTGGVAGLAVAFFYGTNIVSGSGITIDSSSAVSYLTGSDYRLKQSATPLTGALDKVLQAKPITFEFRDNPGQQVQGFFAHELADIYAPAVTGAKDAVDAEGNPQYQGVDHSKLVPLLTAAIKELNAKVEALTQEVAALKGA